MTKKNKQLTGFFVAGCLLAVVIALLVQVVSSGMLGKKDTFCEGIWVDEIALGGMTKEKAKKTVDQYVSNAMEQKVVIQVSEQKVETSAKMLGMKELEDTWLEEAYRIGKTGNLWQRYKQIQEVKKNHKVYTMDLQVTEEAVSDFVKNACSVYDVKAKNSKLSLKNGKFVASEERIGKEVQVDKTTQKIIEAVNQAKDNKTVYVEAVVEDTYPKYTKDMVSKCQDMLGSYATSYASSSAARATNVQTATQRINGTVLYPGQTFSTIRVIKERTVENGYEVASEYSSGKVVDGVGGGVCQVSTTLYNAVLKAELEVVERSPHSMVVSYVDVSRDAAISGDYKDFKFKNNTEAPVYIAATAESGSLSFRIYGEETRETGREVEFQSEILETIEPGPDKEVVDKTKPESYREVTQSAHVGYKAKLWKIVKKNGQETEKVQLNSSTYSAEPCYVTVGAKGKDTPQKSKEPKKTKTPSSSPKATKKESKESVDANHKKQAVKTAAPKATAPSVGVTE